MVSCMIGIQARSTSKRLPGKCLELIDTKTMIDEVIDTCKSSVTFINKKSFFTSINVFICVLIPYNDPLREHLKNILVSEGPEDDVLQRYLQAMGTLCPNYVCRITGDCPLIPPNVISKAINVAIKDNLDYVCNGWEECRTAIDGADVEVISERAMRWLGESAQDPRDREHVTTFLRRNAPKSFKIGQIIGHIDLSHIKLSVDTQEELELVRENKARVNQKLRRAERLKHCIYRF